MNVDYDFVEKITHYLKEELLLSEDTLNAIKNGNIEIISANEKRKFDLAAKGIIELEDGDKDLLDAIRVLGWENDVLV